VAFKGVDALVFLGRNCEPPRLKPNAFPLVVSHYPKQFGLLTIADIEPVRAQERVIDEIIVDVVFPIPFMQ
jgi:hypothetical protein